jgi:hypothetical protein
MAMTATERSRVLRERRASCKIVLTVVVGEDELAEIARAGYDDAASTDRKARGVFAEVTSLEPSPLSARSHHRQSRLPAQPWRIVALRTWPFPRTCR